MTISHVVPLACAFALLSGAAPLTSQDQSLRVAVGTAVPVGGAGERRDAGPAAMLSVDFAPSVRGPLQGNLRLDVEWSLLTAPPSPAGETRPLHGDLRAYGASLNAVVKVPTNSIEPYLLAGIGAYRLQRAGATRNVYGTTPAVQLGVGLDGNRWRRINPFVEARALMHVTDYGSDEFSPTVYWPVLLGVRLR